jgi:hypothetical protein
MYVRHSSVIYSTSKMIYEQPVVSYHYKLHCRSLKKHKVRAFEGGERGTQLQAVVMHVTVYSK